MRWGDKLSWRDGDRERVGPDCPPTPPPRPRHSRQGLGSPPFLPPGCARPGTVRPCPGSGRGSWGVDWAQGEGPPPSDNPPFWPPFWVLHLLRVPEMPPRLSWHSLLSQSLPTPSPCSSSASGCCVQTPSEPTLFLVPYTPTWSWSSFGRNTTALYTGQEEIKK